MSAQAMYVLNARDKRGFALPLAHKDKLRCLRKILGENQTEFWRRFGVSQSSGSRFEQGLPLPASLQILIHLYLDGRVTDHDLSSAMAKVEVACD
ncbi:hypothetical protein GCM10007907_02540 [Chitinimonas prasina]|uniref:RsaL-like HTH domain-containing protein n=1 Tax=Chitinimonas prasina TaxID=1434937 RepID=A0ABQ5YC21_9NEIS|nr:helix-turn-helix transcriptional regulator [Chitinimonas prasina]GLR11464.1 hypothetical protein GCM10007907_02540 [Chitinimonas prasina]